MYEEITYELLLERMLQRVLQEHPNVDTREGSIIYNALAPAAVELQNLYIQLDTVLDQTFADTAGGGYLRRRAAERGIQAMPATKAVLRGEFNREVPLGARFSLGELTYRVLERETGAYPNVRREALPRPVSYTHLDVYKRQPLRPAAGLPPRPSTHRPGFCRRLPPGGACGAAR